MCSLLISIALFFKLLDGHDCPQDGKCCTKNTNDQNQVITHFFAPLKAKTLK